MTDKAKEQAFERAQERAAMNYNAWCAGAINLQPDESRFFFDAGYAAALASRPAERCLVTGNLCGTDTMQAGTVRLCAPCRASQTPRKTCKVHVTRESEPIPSQYNGEKAYSTGPCGNSLPCTDHPAVTPQPKTEERRRFRVVQANSGFWFLWELRDHVWSTPMGDKPIEVIPSGVKQPTTHALDRTSPMGGPFIGKCRLCERTGLPSSAALEPCDNPRGVSADNAVVDAITKDASAAEPEDGPFDCERCGDIGCSECQPDYPDPAPTVTPTTTPTEPDEYACGHIHSHDRTICVLSRGHEGAHLGNGQRWHSVGPVSTPSAAARNAASDIVTWFRDHGNVTERVAAVKTIIERHFGAKV